MNTDEGVRILGCISGDEELNLVHIDNHNLMVVIFHWTDFEQIRLNRKQVELMAKALDEWLNKDEPNYNAKATKGDV